MGKEIGIYKITNIIDNKIYIGSSTKLHKRYYYHLNLLRNNKHYNIHLQYAFNKYNEKSFIFDIVEYCEENVLIEKEEFYIKYYNTLDDNYGYNINPNGDRPPSWVGKKHKNETKIKISQSNKGKIISVEQRELISKTHKGKIISEDHKKILSDKNKGDKNAMYGKKLYDIWLQKFGKEIADEKLKTWKIKISKGSVGKITSEETKIKISQSNKGKIISDETKEKLRQVNIGKKINEETRKKQSEKRKGELNPSCKIKNSDVIKIKKLIDNGIGVTKISKIYNVSRRTIYNIKNNIRKI